MMNSMYALNMSGNIYANTAGINGGNVHQSFKNKYGVGYEDFNSQPYAQPYPTAVIPRTPETPLQKSWFGRLIRKLYSI